jgi:hypothetical protein
MCDKCLVCKCEIAKKGKKEKPPKGQDVEAEPGKLPKQ